MREVVQPNPSLNRIACRRRLRAFRLRPVSLVRYASLNAGAAVEVR